jgi:hypothetical protein
LNVVYIWKENTTKQKRQTQKHPQKMKSRTNLNDKEDGPQEEDRLMEER